MYVCININMFYITCFCPQLQRYYRMHNHLPMALCSRCPKHCMLSWSAGALVSTAAHLSILVRSIRPCGPRENKTLVGTKFPVLVDKVSRQTRIRLDCPTGPQVRCGGKERRPRQLLTDRFPYIAIQRRQGDVREIFAAW